MPDTGIGKKPQKILVVASAFYPHIFGGGEIAAFNKARLLVSRGYDVSVVTLLEKDASPAWGKKTEQGYRLYRLNAPRKYTMFERSDAIPVAKKAVWHLQDYFDGRNIELFSKVLDAVQPDHIQIDNLVGIGFNVLSEIGRRDIPTAFILHGMDFACFRATTFRDGKSCEHICLSCLPVALLRQRALKDIRRLGFIAPSRSILERAREFVPAVNRSLAHVIRNVPDQVPPLPDRTEADHVRLLFVGRLHPFKGIEFLLELLDELSQDYEFHLTVLGTGPSEKKLRKQYGKKSWVSFRGFVPNEEVARITAQSDLSCMTSLVAEPYGIVTAQSLQLGTPVIGSNSGGTAELVRDGATGMLVPPGDKAAWRKALIKIFRNRHLLCEWRKNALNSAHEYDEQIIGKAYEDFIDELSARPARQALTG